MSFQEPAERHERAMEEFYERFPHAEERVLVTVENFETTLARLTDA